MKPRTFDYHQWQPWGDKPHSAALYAPDACGLCGESKRHRCHRRHCADCGRQIPEGASNLLCQACTNQRRGCQFVGVGHSVMYGSEAICTARSKSMAERIAHALNNYTPDRRRGT